jgi:hypothetical protein
LDPFIEAAIPDGESIEESDFLDLRLKRQLNPIPFPYKKNE